MVQALRGHWTTWRQRMRRLLFDGPFPEQPLLDARCARLRAAQRVQADQRRAALVDAAARRRDAQVVAEREHRARLMDGSPLRRVS